MSDAATPEGPESRVVDALREIPDPCSCFTEHPIDIVDLGLIEDVSVEDRTARVRILFTSPMCLYTGEIVSEIERRVAAADGIADVEVIQETEVMWNDDRMDPDVRRERRERFHDEMRDAGITPYADRSESSRSGRQSR